MPEQKPSSKITQLADIKLFIMDVDGVLSDGKIIYSSSGEEYKAFNVKDGLGIKLIHKAKIQTAIITGRNSPIVKKRAEELQIQHVIQGRDDKLKASMELANKLGLKISQIAYIGDDLPDLAAISKLGLGIAVADASPAVREVADYVCRLGGGEGAVREAVEYILNLTGQLQALLDDFR